MGSEEWACGKGEKGVWGGMIGSMGREEGECGEGRGYVWRGKKVDKGKGELYFR